MSHAATNWAILQRGLPPATKLVLWHLCDRHNPDFGCFPSQEQLADDAEVSRSQLNVHLQRLEEAGLIRRVQRTDAKTNRQLSTRYILGFEKSFAQKPSLETGHGPQGTDPEHEQPPCLETGHGIGAEPSPVLGHSRVRKPDSNPVREPVREEEEGAAAPVSSEFWGSVLDAVLKSDDSVEVPLWWRGDHAQHHVAGWLGAGLTEAEVVAEIRAFVSRMPELPEGPKALDKAMARAVKAKGKKKPEPERATATEHLQFLADAVNGDRFLPQTMITMSKARELITAGLVTRERMRERGVQF